MVDIEASANGTTVHAAVGDRVIIRIRENATTGYQWAVREIGEPLELESNELVPPSEMRPGAAGERVVIVRPARSGRGRVALDLKRAWEPTATDHFEVEVDATAS
jgi:predicted secreted protein